MARGFLYLGIDDSGMDARVISPNGEVAGRSQILWADLPESGSGDEAIEQAIPVLADEIDPAACSSAVVLLPDNWFSFRTLTLPFTSRGKIRKILDYELLPSLPRDDTDYISGFHPAGAVYLPSENLVLTASLAQNRVHGLTKALAALNLPLSVIAPQLYTLAASCFTEKKGNRAYLLLGPQTAVLTIVSGSAPVFVRVFSGGISASENLVKQVKSALSGFCLKFGVEPDFEIEMIALGEKIEQEAIEAAFGAEVGQGLWRGIEGRSVFLENALPIPGSLPKGMLNLIDPPFGPAAFFKHHKKGVTAAAGLAAAVLILFMAGIWMDISDLEARVDEKKAEINNVFLQAFPDKAHIMGPYPLPIMTSLVAQAEKQAPGEALTGFDLPGVTRVLAELSARMPKEGDTLITRMNLNKDRLTLAGKTQTFNQVDRIKTGLDASSLFRSVAITNAQADKSGNSVRFTVVLTL